MWSAKKEIQPEATTYCVKLPALTPHAVRALLLELTLRLGHRLVSGRPGGGNYGEGQRDGADSVDEAHGSLLGVNRRAWRSTAAGRVRGEAVRL